MKNYRDLTKQPLTDFEKQILYGGFHIKFKKKFMELNNIKFKIVCCNGCSTPLEKKSKFGGKKFDFVYID